MSIAKSLASLTNNHVVSAALNREESLDDAILTARKAWHSDLLARRPSSSFLETEDERVYKGTDLDLFSVLTWLAERKAVINFPDTYRGMRPTATNPNERIISQKDRHGKIYAVVSNAKTHAFSVRFFDHNVIVTDSETGEDMVGAWRNFTLVDDFGSWHGGWKRLEFTPTPEEDKFFREQNLYAAEETIEFNNFLHPSLAGAFHGARYLSTKALEMRVTEEKSHYNSVARGLRKQGVTLPEDEPSPSFQRKSRPGEKVKVPVLEAKLILPEYTGSFSRTGQRADGERYRIENKSKGSDQDELRYAEEHRKRMSREQTYLRARARAVELAFFSHGRYENGEEKPVGWDVPEWQRGYKESQGSRTLWNAMPLDEETALLYRDREVTATVTPQD